MKKVYLILGIFPFVAVQVLYPQVKFLPRSIDISVPALEKYEYYTHTNTSMPTDSAWEDTIQISLIESRPSTIYGYSRVGDSVAFTYNPTLLERIKISFLFDSVESEIHNCAVSYEYFHVNGDPSLYWSTSYLFSTLHYEMVSDTILAISSQGALCENQVISASYYYSEVYGSPRYTEQDDRTIKILDDTAAFKCNISFAVQMTTSVVPIGSSPRSLSSMGVSYPDHNIQLSIESSPSAQRMIIYDLLGRPIRQFEILSGTSEYTISQYQLPSGYYFARLGNMSAKFIVN